MHKLVKKEKEIRVTLAVTPQTAKVIATVHGKCLVKMEKTFSLYSKVLRERERVRKRERETTFT